MNLFSSRPSARDPAQVAQLKRWLFELLKLEADTVISINQLQCHEPDCPPIETAILVMTDPVKQIKIHKTVAEIEPADLVECFQHHEERIAPPDDQAP